MNRAQARDREAFEMLVEQHATETYRLATAIVGAADAADVARRAVDSVDRRWVRGVVPCDAVDS